MCFEFGQIFAFAKYLNPYCFCILRNLTIWCKIKGVQVQRGARTIWCKLKGVQVQWGARTIWCKFNGAQEQFGASSKGRKNNLVQAQKGASSMGRKIERSQNGARYTRRRINRFKINMVLDQLGAKSTVSNIIGVHGPLHGAGLNEESPPHLKYIRKIQAICKIYDLVTRAFKGWNHDHV